MVKRGGSVVPDYGDGKEIPSKCKIREVGRRQFIGKILFDFVLSIFNTYVDVSKRIILIG